MAKRIVTKIGDVFCVEVDNTYKRYFQYFCNDMTQLNSDVIRAFKKRYPMDYKPKPEDIVKDEVDFYAHTILRNGIEDGLWYKVGKAKGEFEEEMSKPLFGTCRETKYINGDIIDVDPNSNWYVWRINSPFKPVGILPEMYRDVVDWGSVKPDVEIFDRIKYGYYRWTSPAYNLLRRHPHPDIDSYVRRETDGSIIYLHFKGENVVQKIEVDSNGEASKEEGNPLPLLKFWENNWKYAEFITMEEFEEEWNKYLRKGEQPTAQTSTS